MLRYFIYIRFILQFLVFVLFSLAFAGFASIIPIAQGAFIPAFISGTTLGMIIFWGILKFKLNCFYFVVYSSFRKSAGRKLLDQHLKLIVAHNGSSAVKIHSVYLVFHIDGAIYRYTTAKLT